MSSRKLARAAGNITVNATRVEGLLNHLGRVLIYGHAPSRLPSRLRDREPRLSLERACEPMFVFSHTKALRCALELQVGALVSRQLK